MMGSVDQAFSTLIQDMDERGLLEDTLVCFVTEFGRTPKLNKAQGRDHWSRAYSIVMAGAGVPGGQIIGASDRQGAFVTERPYTPDDYAATVYKKLGLNLDKTLQAAGRSANSTSCKRHADWRSLLNRVHRSPLNLVPGQDSN